MQDIDETNNSSQLDVVFGVGQISRLGYRIPTRDDLVRDLLFDNGGYDPQLIVDDVFPVLVNSRVYVPIFKYLRGACVIDESGKLCANDLNTRVAQAATRAANPEEKRFHPSSSYNSRWRRQAEDGQLSFADIIENGGVRDAVNLIPLLDWDEIPPEELGRFLVSHAKFLEEPVNMVERLQFIKVVCLYDYLRYGRKPA